MDTDCFNMAVRMLACNEGLLCFEDKYHYMDLQFCVSSYYYLYPHRIFNKTLYFTDNKQSISAFSRGPPYRVKLDIKRLAKLFECWPDMEYDIEHCSNVSYIPSSFINLGFCCPNMNRLFADSIAVLFYGSVHIIRT